MRSRYKQFLACALIGASFLPVAAQAQEHTLHILIEETGESKFLETVLPEFTAETGIKVELEKLAYPDMHNKLVTQLTSAQSNYEVIPTDFLWAGEFRKADWILELNPFLKNSKLDVSSFEPAIVKVLGNDNTAESVRTIPWFNYSMGLVYRKDLLDDPELGKKYQAEFGTALTVPKDVASYVQIAKFMKKNAHVNGAAMQGQRGDPNSMEFSNYLFGNGGTFFGPDGKVTLGNEKGEQAIGYYADMIKNAAQTGAMSANFDDVVRTMCAGDAFSMVTFWYQQPQINTSKDCPNVNGKLALTGMPGGAGLSGAWGWSIAKNIPPEAQADAFKFIEWVQSEPMEKRLALLGHAPTRKSVFLDPDVLKAYPEYSNVQKLVTSGGSFPVFLYSAQYEDVLGTQLSLASSGDITAKQAATAAASGLQDLVDKAN
jgi:multiple sugar transport system substrate-binding protein